MVTTKRLKKKTTMMNTKNHDYHDPNLGLTTKARACKGASRE